MDITRAHFISAHTQTEREGQCDEMSDLGEQYTELILDMEYYLCNFSVDLNFSKMKSLERIEEGGGMEKKRTRRRGLEIFGAHL